LRFAPAASALQCPEGELQKRKEAAAKPTRMLQQTEHTRKTAVAAIDRTRPAKAQRVIRKREDEDKLRATLLGQSQHADRRRFRRHN